MTGGHSDSSTLERRGVLYVGAAALLWSTGGVAIKAVDALPLVIAFYRSAVAAVVLFALLRPRVKRWSPGFVIAVVSYAGCLTTFVVATRWTTAANAIFLQYMGVVWVMLLAPLILREPLQRRDAIAVGIAFAGMALFFVEKLEGRGLAGSVAALVSSVFFAIMILALRAERDASAEAAVAWGNVLLAAVLLPFIAGDLRVDAGSAILLGFLGVFQIALAYLFFVRGLRWVTATEASLTGMIEPVLNPLWVLLFLGEIPSMLALLGGAIVLSAVAWRTLLPAAPVPVIPPPD